MSVSRQALTKQLSSGSKKKLQARSFQQNLQNKSVSLGQNLLQAFLIVSRIFWCHISVVVSGNTGAKVSVVEDLSSAQNKKCTLLPQGMKIA